jgi:hypothetical protein
MVLYNQAKQCTDDAGVQERPHYRTLKPKRSSSRRTLLGRRRTIHVITKATEAVKVKKNIRDVLSLSC